MPKSELQKLKTMYIADMMLHETDEQHKLTSAQIVKKLNALGLKAERKSIYNDMDLLQQYGFDIILTHGRGGGYWLASREFETAELKLLVDAVQSSKFLTEKKSRSLIKKLEGLANKWDAQTLQRQVYVMGRVKSMNESIYYTIDKLHTAINAGKIITFKYFEWGLDKKPIYRHDGARYIVSPFTLARDDENYYLIAYSEKDKEMRHYRVDKMNSIEITSVPRNSTGVEEFERIDLAQYLGKMFGMFGGEAQRLEIKFKNSLANVVIDRYGKDVALVRVDDEHFKAYIDAVISPMLMGWLASFGDGAQLLSPPSAVQQFKEHCEAIVKLYK